MRSLTAGGLEGRGRAPVALPSVAPDALSCPGSSSVRRFAGSAASLRPHTASVSTAAVASAYPHRPAVARVLAGTSRSCRTAKTASSRCSIAAGALHSCDSEASPCSAADILPVMFKRKLDLHQTTFAIGESIAHLHLLWFGGQLRRSLHPDGVYRFSAA